jgi:hypothetical protein
MRQYLKQPDYAKSINLGIGIAASCRTQRPFLENQATVCHQQEDA